MDYSLHINGAAVPTADHFDIFNPATGDLLGRCPVATEAQLNDAVAAAKAAFQSWRLVSDADRKAACHAMGQVIEDHAEELAKLLTQEQGKPLNGLGSRFEIGGCQAWTHYTADLELPVEVIQDNEEGRVELHRKPVGVVGSITPWNWPLMIAIWHVIPAIRSGNTVVIKPSPFTPLSTLRLVELISGVLPKGVLNVVAGRDNLGQLMSEHKDIQKIVFTGSCATGEKIMASAAPTLKRLTLELGGNDAGIVLPDVDAKAIAEGLFWGAFINGGQTCAALKRLYVHEDVYEDVCAALAEFAGNIPMGEGLDENMILGPVQNKMQYDKVKGLVDDAVAQGARVLLGANPQEGPGYFYPATLLADVSDGMRVVDEEQFGPVLPIIKYSSIEDAIARANASDNGLGGSIWSTDLERAKALAAELECGSAWINKHGMIQPNVPFGGVKGSGIGVEFGEEGLKEYTTIQAIYA
ncbi:aldehyde dehydrogenase family protein [Paremcibacter congregatus]|uniref:Aldehyde dehydrogenase n=1 Tax=Paremcibacter congregatus TaxID=2043170 RepID=A0A2G4YQ60_9PROT|nr:aldehyde dehydrogenase family protein [Paremcibacter congregatus]PHZ84445.1 aldehyde dehydrogenase [Paremcibacter congregatus]QDE28663.1 aldehyde dehydrogenase family protein [Paremcibacter congregatus]